MKFQIVIFYMVAFLVAIVSVENAFAINEDFKLTASDGALFDRFGSSVSISGDKAIVGAWGDDDNENRSGSAYVFVLETNTPEMLIDDTIEDIQNLIDNEGLNKGIGNSLISSLEAAGKSLDKENLNAACNQLGSLINKIDAQENKKLSEIQPQELRDAVNEIKSKLSCS